MPSNFPVHTGRYALSYHTFYVLFWVIFACSLNATAVQAAESPLNLSDAMSRAMAQNPRLQVFGLRLDELQGRRITADLNPSLEAGAEVENFLGTDDVRGLVGAELTLTLSSTLELGETFFGKPVQFAIAPGYNPGWYRGQGTPLYLAK